MQLLTKLSLSILFTATLTFSVVMAETAVIAKTTGEQLQQARATVKAYAALLQGTLKPAMQSGGPLAAITACNHSADSIEQLTNKQSDWQVGRTSLKVRNSANQPDQWELATLKTFEQRKAKGEDINTIEFAETIVVDGKSTYRYMKAIPTAELCLNCHGSNINQDVAAKLKQLYPSDQATGFNRGDIRGAFSVKTVF